MTVDNKTNEFKITGGETIKIGRVKFIVREIQTQDDENQTNYDSCENELQIDERGVVGQHLQSSIVDNEANVQQRDNFLSFNNRMVSEEEEKIENNNDV